MTPLVWIAFVLLLAGVAASVSAALIYNRAGGDAAQQRRQKRLAWTAVPLFAAGAVLMLVGAFTKG